MQAMAHGGDDLMQSTQGGREWQYAPPKESFKKGSNVSKIEETALKSQTRAKTVSQS